MGSHIAGEPDYRADGRGDAAERGISRRSGCGGEDLSATAIGVRYRTDRPSRQVKTINVGGIMGISLAEPVFLALPAILPAGRASKAIPSFGRMQDEIHPLSPRESANQSADRHRRIR